MASQEYWKNREKEAKKHNIQEEAEYNRKIKEIYANMMDEINKEINGFYTKYAAKEGITMAEAKKRVSKLDIAAYERKAKKYVETKDFSNRANEEMRIYNLTMKVNRLELLKANIGLEMVSGFDEMQKYFDKKLTDRTLKEFQRQAGILGKSVLKNEKYAHAIVNASFKNATYSDRIWMYQGMLKAELEGLLASGLIRGQNPKKLAKHLEKRFGVSAYNAQRLMTTELARVQTEAQKQSFIRTDQQAGRVLKTYTYMTSHLRKQNPWYWNWGHCDLRKEGSKLTFFYNGSYPSFNIPEIADMKCAKIQIAIKQRGTRSGNKYLTYNGINAFYFQKLHVKKWRDVPNKFAQDCSLIANCSDGSIRMNGLPKPDLGALGNDWETFCLKPGVNQVQCLCSSWAKKPTFKMKYREVFL